MIWGVVWYNARMCTHRKLETNSKAVMYKCSKPKVWAFGIFAFGFVSNFDIRISCFEQGRSGDLSHECHKSDIHGHRMSLRQREITTYDDSIAHRRGGSCWKITTYVNARAPRVLMSQKNVTLIASRKSEIKLACHSLGVAADFNDNFFILPDCFLTDRSPTS